MNLFSSGFIQEHLLPHINNIQACRAQNLARRAVLLSNHAHKKMINVNVAMVQPFCFLRSIDKNPFAVE